VKGTAQRGKIDVFIAVDAVTEEDSRIRLNMAAAKQYFAGLRELQENFNVSGGIDLSLLANMPDVLRQIPDVEDEEAFLRVMENALRAALDPFDAMRRAEGEKLSEDMLARGLLLAADTEKIETFAPDMARAYGEKLRDRIREIAGDVEIPEERLALEVAMFADKSNVTEELVRLKSHLAQLERIVREDAGANGKKLDFLAQEMNREVNTIGSKANDLRVTNLVLAMKSEVEKIREQVQNVE
jgi:uncharacterized protein (TIGR00255 family)